MENGRDREIEREREKKERQRKRKRERGGERIKMLHLQYSTASTVHFRPY